MNDEVVLIALGSNLGDREGHLVAALETVTRLVRVDGASQVYETEPWGYSDQPRFLNAVIKGTTGLVPLDLLAGLKHIENELGRTATFRNGPRVIDLDVLAYGRWVFRSTRLELPHPRMHERFFVLQPLCDVAPEWRHPALGFTAAEMRDALVAAGEKPPEPFASAVWNRALSRLIL